MSIFGSIAAAIFGTPAHAAGAPPAPAASSAVPGSTSVVTAANDAQPPAAAAKSHADVMAILDKMHDASDEDLDWSTSIVDLMKLLKLDSGLSARKELATELGYTGDMKDSAKMNIWLHKAVMAKLADNGGIVPKELMD
ncbi:MAG: DUF3597 domain-containing protein [Hyphomicrobium aestuarii]|nr:DUF3597 domain-containing protein [Hyphomicrobium aestuarii]